MESSKKFKKGEAVAFNSRTSSGTGVFQRYEPSGRGMWVVIKRDDNAKELVLRESQIAAKGSKPKLPVALPTAKATKAVKTVVKVAKAIVGVKADKIDRTKVAKATTAGVKPAKPAKAKPAKVATAADQAAVAAVAS